MIGRRYAPHFDLLFLAALRVGTEMATLVGNTADADAWAAAYETGYAWVNANFSYVKNESTGVYDATGLWDGRSYSMAFYDGRPINWTMSDTAVGIFFGVVPADRVRTIWEWEEKNGNRGAYGMRDVYPYISFGDNP
jgi:hypothetical protein